MKLIIDIPNKDYDKLKDGHIPFGILDVIQNGAPLEDILQIIDNAKWMNKVLRGESNIEADKAVEE